MRVCINRRDEHIAKGLRADPFSESRTILTGTVRHPVADSSLLVATKSPSSIPFRLMAVIFGLAVLYHAAALSIPAFAKAAYPATYQPLRHVAFIIVNSVPAFLFLKRPRWFIWPYLVLTAQVLQGHGVRLWHTWVDAHQINWIDVIVVSGVLLGLVLLLQERKDKGNNGSAHNHSTAEQRSLGR
jgi:hypothetical protein